MSEQHYEWVQDEPFLKITLRKEGYELPPTVLGHIFTHLAFMTNPENAADMNLVAAGFECSRIDIGFSPEEEAEMIEYHA